MHMESLPFLLSLPGTQRHTGLTFDSKIPREAHGVVQSGQALILEVIDGCVA